MKSIIVREYLQSLKESDELDYLFTILLEVMGFKIISSPRLTKGLPQYGKDVVAIGLDPKDGVKKRFYFEVKGGSDKDITTTTYNKNDGIRESIREAKDRPYRDSSNPGFNSLPVKIVLVHNGTIHPSVKETFDGFIETEFPVSNTNFEFERWDIFALTSLFAQHLFDEYLLADADTAQLFKKVLVLIDSPKNNFTDYYELINLIIKKAGPYASLGKRKKVLFFETLNLVSFIIHSYCKESGNLENAKKCLPYSILKLWAWILENSIESDTDVLKHFQKHSNLFIGLLDEYFIKTIQVATLENGLWSFRGGRYEQIGYPLRTMEYLSYLIFFIEALQHQGGHDDKKITDYLIPVLNGNQRGTRPLLDNHSIPICLILNYLIKNNRIDDAKALLRNVFDSIHLGHLTHNRLPDGSNKIENIIRYTINREKTIFYIDSTSHLIGILFEYLAVLDLEEEYTFYRQYFTDLKIDLAVFIPFDDDKLSTQLPDVTTSHEHALFTHQIYKEGYQSQVILDDSFQEFKNRTLSKNEFSYAYKIDISGFGHLRHLAHIFFKTPIFPNEWRSMAINQQESSA